MPLRVSTKSFASPVNVAAKPCASSRRSFSVTISSIMSSISQSLKDISCCALKSLSHSGLFSSRPSSMFSASSIAVVSSPFAFPSSVALSYKSVSSKKLAPYLYPRFSKSSTVLLPEPPRDAKPSGVPPSSIELSYSAQSRPDLSLSITSLLRDVLMPSIVFRASS